MKRGGGRTMAVPESLDGIFSYFEIFRFQFTFQGGAGSRSQTAFA